MVVQNCFKDAEKFATGIPAYYAGSKEVSVDYIYAMVDSGFYATAYPQAIDLFGGRNIIQIHRDLPGSCPSSYRVLLTKQMGEVPRDSELLYAQIEFYIPLPHLLDKAKEHFLKYVLNADISQICYSEPYTAGVTYRKISLTKEPGNKLESAILEKFGTKEFYIIVK